MKFNILLLLLLILPKLFFSQDQENETYRLFNEPEAHQKSLIPADDELLRVGIEINPKILQTDYISQGDNILVDLFTGEHLVVSVKGVEKNVMGVITIVGGTKTDESHGSLIITFDKENRLFATARLFDKNRLFHITSNPLRNEHYLVEKNIEAMDFGKCEGVITEDNINY